MLRAVPVLSTTLLSQRAAQGPLTVKPAELAWAHVFRVTPESDVATYCSVFPGRSRPNMILTGRLVSGHIGYLDGLLKQQNNPPPSLNRKKEARAP